MAVSAGEDPHPRRAKADTEAGLLVIQVDYGLHEEHLTLLIAKDRQSRVTLAYDCETKGPGDTRLSSSSMSPSRRRMRRVPMLSGSSRRLVPMR